jgi:hypothetical protein
MISNENKHLTLFLVTDTRRKQISFISTFINLLEAERNHQISIKRHSFLAADAVAMLSHFGYVFLLLLLTFRI